MLFYFIEAGGSRCRIDSLSHEAAGMPPASCQPRLWVFFEKFVVLGAGDWPLAYGFIYFILSGFQSPSLRAVVRAILIGKGSVLMLRVCR